MCCEVMRGVVRSSVVLQGIVRCYTEIFSVYLGHARAHDKRTRALPFSF